MEDPSYLTYTMKLMGMLSKTPKKWITEESLKNFLQILKNSFFDYSAGCLIPSLPVSLAF